MIELAYHQMDSDGNLTRCYRTIYTLIGPTTVHLIDSACQIRAKHLHSSKDQIAVRRYETEAEFFEINSDANHIVIETNGRTPLKDIRDSISPDKTTILHFGGESVNLPTRGAPWSEFPRYRIDTENRLCLINDVVTGIVLYEITRGR